MIKKLILLTFLTFYLGGCMQEEKSWSVSDSAAYLLVYSDVSSLSLSPAEFHYYDSKGNFLEMHKSTYSGIWLDTCNKSTLFLAGGNNQLLAYDINNHEITEYHVQGEIGSIKANEEVVVYHTTYNGKYSSQLCRIDLKTSNTECIDAKKGTYIHSLLDDFLITVSFDGNTAQIFDYNLNLIQSLDLNKVNLSDKLPFILRDDTLYHPIDNQYIANYPTYNDVLLFSEGILGLNTSNKQSSLLIQPFQSKNSNLIYTWDYPVEFHTSICNQEIALLGKNENFELEFLNLDTLQTTKIKTAKTVNLVAALSIKKTLD